MSALHAVIAAMRLQASITMRTPTQLMTLLTTPLFSAVYFSVVLGSDRSDLLVNALVAPGLTGIWFVAVQVGAGVIADDRWGNRLELLITTGVPFALVVFGRILVIVGMGAVTFVESWLVGRFGFGVHLPVEHPVLFALTVLSTCLAGAGTATALSAAFVLSRNLGIFQNSLTYPVFVLGGVFVPLSALPDWLGFLSNGVFLSWSADLLRDAVVQPDITGWGYRLTVVLGLGALALSVGLVLTRIVIERSRTTASAGMA